MRDSGPCFYVYRLTLGNRVQTGLVAAAVLAKYEYSRIRHHESTNPDKVADRAKQIQAINAQTGLVMVAHPILVISDGGLIERLARELERHGRPLYR